MSATEEGTTGRDASVGRVDMKLELQIIPVSDVDRSKQFYEQLGWRFDRDVAPMDGPSRRPVHAPGLACLDHVRPGSHDGGARGGRGRGGRLRHRGGAR